MTRRQTLREHVERFTSMERARKPSNLTLRIRTNTQGAEAGEGDVWSRDPARTSQRPRWWRLMTSTVRERPHAALTQRLFGFDFIDDADCASTVERTLGRQPRTAACPSSSPRTSTTSCVCARTVTRPWPPRTPFSICAPGRSTDRLVEPAACCSLAGRLPGSTLFPPLWQRACHERRRVVVVAPAAAVGTALRREHPDLGIVVPPHFDVYDDAELDAVVTERRQQIERIDAELVFIGSDSRSSSGSRWR